MQLFYLPNFNPHKNTTHNFNEPESRHIVKTLRKHIGDTLYVTDGKGHLIKVKLIDNHYKRCSFIVEKSDFFERQTPQVSLAVAPTKINERYEWLVEKATEIGVANITPIICNHSERKTIKVERLQKITTSAMKQSLQYYLPKIQPTIGFHSFLDCNLPQQRFIAHCQEGATHSLFSVINPKEDVIVLIGPEGDFSKNEIDFAMQKSFIPVSLGQTRLRTETAALVACHTISLAYETL